MTNLYTIVGLAMFLAIGGDAWTLRGLTATFNAIPIGDSVQADAAGRSLLSQRSRRCSSARLRSRRR